MKTLITGLLAPAARIAKALEMPRRAWAHARMAGMIAGKLDRSVVVLGVPEIRGTGQIYAGRNLYLYRDLYLETQGEGRIEIGDDVVISRGAHIAALTRVSIGADSMIGEYASLRDANHRFGGGVKIRTSGYSSAAIEIGRNVWIARGVTILPGVRIGDNAVVGANAVVTRDVPDGAVVGGIPAQPIRSAAARA
jgi:acetyltransferase-like isoleucine patch superfamily enzyme